MKHDYSSLIDDYKKNGFVIVDNLLPEEVANKLEIMYSDEDTKWEFIDQYRDQAYSKGKYGKQYTDSPYFPGVDEAYTAKFWRSNILEKMTENIFDKYFKPVLKSISQSELSEYDVRCYKLDDGCHYRTHIDDWLGEIGCVYSINKSWIWDWGGILHVGMDDGGDQIIPIFPKFNRAVFISHGGFRFPHFISPVTNYALNSRFSMISFNK
jgi:Rps23 Pro-64 3,4-dihydroxylase Tpa1-like proline 4-hydroxylase